MGTNDEYSFFIIKPEAFNKREEIKRIITQYSTLTIVATKIVFLTEIDIDTLYFDDIGTELEKATKAHLVGAVVEVGIVAGINAITELTRICGKYPFPDDCSDGTIRKQYGRSQPTVYQSITYYLNAIHKASKNEVSLSLEWFARKT